MGLSSIFIFKRRDTTRSKDRSEPPTNSYPLFSSNENDKRALRLRGGGCCCCGGNARYYDDDMPKRRKRKNNYVFAYSGNGSSCGGGGGGC
ncbi:hypothetical protein V866_003007 [Kwoniella sp. B9012]